MYTIPTSNNGANMERHCVCNSIHFRGIILNFIISGSLKKSKQPGCRIKKVKYPDPVDKYEANQRCGSIEGYHEKAA